MSSRRLTSLLVSLLASLVGLPLLWYAGGRVLTAQLLFVPDAGETALWSAVAVLAALVVGLTGFAVRWSSLGPIVVGALHLVLSLGAVLMPYSPLDQTGFSPVSWALFRLNELDRPFANGAFTLTFQGVGLLIGAALVAVGIAARLRRRSGVGWAVLSTVAGLVALAVALQVVWLGARNYELTLVRFQQDPLIAGGLVLFALLFGALLLPSARSAIELWIVGGGLTLAGIAFAIPAVVQLLPGEWWRAVAYLGFSGLLLALGLTVLGLALGVTLRPVAPVAPPVAPVAAVDPSEVAPPSAV